MRKIIQKIGNSKGIIFNKEEQETYNIDINKIIEIKEFKITKRQNHPISKCNSCYSMTHTIINKCGKCGAKKI